MNDFTKEELLKLYSEFNFIVEEYCDPDEIEISIRDKLKHMIDDYCEHKIGDEQIATQAGHFIRCAKCLSLYKV